MEYKGGIIKGFSHIINEFKTAGNWTTASNWSLGKVPTTEIAFINANCTWSGLSTFSGRLIIAEGRTLTVSSWTNTNNLTIKDITLNGSLSLNSANFYFTNFLKFGENGSMSGSQRINIRGGGRIINLNKNIFMSNGITGSLNGGPDFLNCVGCTLNGSVDLRLYQNGVQILIPQKFTFNSSVFLDRIGTGIIGSVFSVQENERLVTFNGSVTFYGTGYQSVYRTYFKGNLTLGNTAATGGGNISGTFFIFDSITLTATTTDTTSISSTSTILSGKTLSINSTVAFFRITGTSLNGEDSSSNLSILTNSMISTTLINFMALGNLICGTGSTVEYNFNGNQNIKNATYHNLNLITFGVFTKTLTGNTIVNGNLYVNVCTLNRNGFNLTVLGATSLQNGATIIN